MAEGNTPREILTPKPERPIFSEPLVVKDNKRIKVISGDHGTLVTNFPDKKKIEDEIDRTYEDQPLAALVVDSQSPLRYSEGLIIDIVTQTGGKQDSNFPEWSIWYAAHKGAALIGADPNHLVIGYNLISKAKGQGYAYNPANPYQTSHRRIKGSPEFKSLEAQNRTFDQEKRDFWGQRTQSAINETIGLALIAGLIRSKARLTRRQFLKLAGVGVAAEIFSHLRGLQDLQQIESELSDSRARMSGMLAAEGFDIKYFDSVAPLAAIQADEKNILSHPSVDRNSEAFRRQALYYQSQWVTIALRNALIAEVLASPPTQLSPGFTTDKILNIPVVMGDAHSVVPDNKTISYLVSHDKERYELLETLLTAFIMEVRDGVGKGLDVDYMKSNLLNFGRVYQISKTGMMTERSFQLAGLEKILRNA